MNEYVLYIAGSDKMNSMNIKFHFLVNIFLHDYSLTDCKLTAWC